MYCANCGVQLADTEKGCPLCGMRAHPDMEGGKELPFYPQRPPSIQKVNFRGLQIIWIAVFLLPMLICVQCDLLINGGATWSGYVIGALLCAYVILVLPTWFRKPNPVIFVPCGFAAVGGYLLYIQWMTGGDWFLSFAFPVVGFLCLVVTAVVTLVRYVRRGYLYIFGGAVAALGGFMPLMGFLINLTFLSAVKFALWSLYPMTALLVVGGTVIFLAICRPAREIAQRKFFI